MEGREARRTGVKEEEKCEKDEIVVEELWGKGEEWEKQDVVRKGEVLWHVSQEMKEMEEEGKRRCDEGRTLLWKNCGDEEDEKQRRSLGGEKCQGNL